MSERKPSAGNDVNAGLVGWLCLLLAVGAVFTPGPWLALVPAAIGGALVAADRVRRR
ncbi:MAG: hypothetical protein LBE25_13700 [Arthrobacter sp.]|jgi:hypothetical protein|nr:hypothetical protein [Arthrobacter sp.]